MADIRRRPVAKSTPAVARRRDRAPLVPVEDDDDDDVDAVAPRRTLKRPAAAVVKRRSYDEVEDEAEDDLEDDPEDETPVAPRRSQRAAAARPAKRRAPALAGDDDDDEPPVRKRVALPPAVRSSRTDGPPPGIHTGWAGAEAVAKSSGGGAQRLILGADHELIRFLEPEPFLAYRQHWASAGPGQPERPFPCIGAADCPLCGGGDTAVATFGFNILHLSDPDGPSVKVLQIGIKAEKALKEAAADRATGNPRLEKDFFAVSRSGKGQQSQTNFRPVKLRDLEEDWPEVLEQIDVEDLPAIIEDAKERCFDYSIVQTFTAKQLREVARYLVEE